MKKVLLILVSLLVLGGIIFAVSSKDDPASQKPRQIESAVDTSEKSGTTTKTGKISSTGGRFYLGEAGQAPLELDSYAVDLNDYLGKTVTVTGKYSGDTLFVSGVN